MQLQYNQRILELLTELNLLMDDELTRLEREAKTPDPPPDPYYNVHFLFPKTTGKPPQ